MNLSQMIPPNANNIVDHYREFMTDEPVASAEQDVAEEKPSSSNPLAGVMDRLTAIATKVKSFPEGTKARSPPPRRWIQTRRRRAISRAW